MSPALASGPSCGRSDLEKRKDPDSEPGSATGYLCGQRACWQPRHSQGVGVTGAEVGGGRDGKREAWLGCRGLSQGSHFVLEPAAGLLCGRTQAGGGRGWARLEAWWRVLS